MLWGKSRPSPGPVVMPPANFLVDAIGGKVVLTIRWGNGRDVTITQSPEQTTDLIILLAQAVGAARQQATANGHAGSDGSSEPGA